MFYSFRFYRLPDGTKVDLDKNKMKYAAHHTRQYANDYTYDENLQKRTYEQSSQVIVVNGDCLDAAICMKAKYPKSNPVVLNMASKRNPGGGWKNGGFILIEISLFNNKRYFHI